MGTFYLGTPYDMRTPGGFLVDCSLIGRPQKSKKPSVQNVAKIAEALEVKIEVLLKE